MSDFSPVDKAARAKAKKDLLNLDPKTVVISVVGRLDPQKRPVLVPDIADQLRKLGDYKPGSFVIVMLGDGDLKDRVKARIAEMKVNSFVRLVGTVERPQDYLAATDVFLLPSMSEGISIAVAEAMAMSLPIVTARAGALPEQLGYEEGDSSLIAGVLIDHKLDAAHDAPLYAKELHTLVSHPELRDEYGQNGRRNVEATFNWRNTLEGMFAEVEKARLPDPKKARHMPNPAAHYAIQNLLVEAHDVRGFVFFPSDPAVRDADAGDAFAFRRKPISGLSKPDSRRLSVPESVKSCKTDAASRMQRSRSGSTRSSDPINAKTRSSRPR